MFFKGTMKKKGMSSIIGATFMVILILVTLNTYLTQITYYDSYNESLFERNSRKWKKSNEKFRIIDIEIYNQKPNVTVVNEGAIPLHLVDLWITEKTVGFNSSNVVFAIDVIIPPAAHVIDIGQDLNTTLDGTHTYSMRVYSERGNFAKRTFIPPASETEVGPFYFTFDKLSFNYTTSNAGDGIAWEIIASPSQEKEDIIFVLKFTNHGDEAIEISRLTYLMLIVPINDYVEDEYYFYILNNTSTSDDPISYDDYSQVIDANPEDKVEGVSDIIKFGARKPGTSTLQDFPLPEANEWTYGLERKYLYTNYIAVFWRWKGSYEYYGIYVPFSCIHVRSS